MISELFILICRIIKDLMIISKTLVEFKNNEILKPYYLIWHKNRIQ